MNIFQKLFNKPNILYLSYGSNLYVEQMDARSPSNIVIGKYDLPNPWGIEKLCPEIHQCEFDGNKLVVWFL